MDQRQKDFKECVIIISRLMIIISSLVGIVACFLIYMLIDPNFSAFRKSKLQTDYMTVLEEDKIENGIHLRTGLIEAKGLMEVVNNCTNCHSSKLITQNRMNRERWAATIDWMQETQNLWDLGENEEIIINYLITNYPPQKKGRRQSLININWYELQN